MLSGEWVFDHDVDGLQDGPSVFFAPDGDGDEFRFCTLRPFVGDFYLADPGAMPIGIDADSDGLLEPGTYTRLDGLWQYWPSLSGGTPDAIWWHGNHPREYPVIGEFDGDGWRNDIGLADPWDPNLSRGGGTGARAF